MRKQNNPKTVLTQLRQKAEELLKSKLSQSRMQLLNADDLKLLQELEVYQLELEMQNKELLLSQADVQQAAEKYAELYDSAPTGYFALSTKGEITELNLSGAAMLGKPRQNLKNSSLGFFISMETRPAYNQFLDNIFYKQTKETCEATLLAEGHQPMPVLIAGIADKNLEHCLISVVDITERKQAEKALLDSEQKYRLMLESSEIGMGVFSLDGKILYYNQRALRNLGGKADDYIGKTLHEIFGEAAASVFVAHILESAQSEKSIEYEEFVKLAPGNRWFLSIYSRLTNPDGKVFGVQLIAHDITERKQSEETFRVLTEFADSLISSMPDGVLVLDANGIHKDVNPSFCRITGFSREELIGTGAPHPYWPPEEYERIEAAFQKTMASDSTNFELVFMRKNGERFPAIVSPFAIKDKLGNTISYSATVKDISERKQAEIQLQQSEHNLAEAERIGNTGSWKYDIVTKTSTWSQNMFRIFDVDPLMPKELAFPYFVENLVYPDDRAYVTAFFQDALAGKAVDKMEYRIINSANRIRYIHALAEVISDADGNPVQMIGKVEDITERKLNEDALKHSEHNLAEAERIGNTGSWEYDVASDTATWSDNMFRIFNVDPLMPKELVFKYFVGNLVHPDDRENVVAVFQDALAGRRTYDLEYRILKSGNCTRYIHALAEVIRDTEANPVQMIGKVEDITERRLNEQALKQSKIQLELAHQLAGAGTWDWDMASNQLSWSKELFALFGLDADQDTATFETWTQVVHPEDGAGASESIEQAIRDKTLLNSEYRILHSDGKIHWISSLGNTIYNIAGEPVRMSGICTDITDRKKVEIELHLSNAYLENLVNYANAPIIVWDSQFRITRFNHAFESLTGRSESDVLGQSLKILFPTASIEKSMALIRKTLTGERMETVEIEIIHYDKSIRTLLWNSATLFTPDGKTPIATIAQGHNITERKQTEEALLKSEEQFRALFENSIDSVAVHQVILDDNENPVDYIFLRANAAFELQTGLHIAGIIGKRVTEVIPGIENSPFIGIYGKVALSGESITFEQFFEPLGKHYHINAYQVGYGFFVTVFQDITESRKREEEIKNKNEELQKLNIEKDKFFSIIAHDLRSPFNSFLGLTKMIEEELSSFSPDELQSSISSMRKSAGIVFHLLENLLEWSRMQRGLHSFRPVSFQLSENLITNIELVRLASEKKNIRIIQQIPDRLAITADPQMFQSLMSNLVFNAVKFTPVGGEVTIAAKELPDQTIILSVCDNGIGMDKNTLDNLFSINRSNYRKGTEGEPSSGLGLVICKDFVDKHGGEIWVESQTGKGSTFYFSIPHIPVQEEKKETGKVETETEKIPRDTKLKILVAEDDEATQLFISLALKPLSREIIKAVTGVEAVNACSQHPDIDLILMDIKMPEMDGYEATRQIRMFNKKVVIIAQTAFIMADNRKQAMAAGCNEFIPKPLDLNLLKGMIKKCCEVN
jgi:PAS domain S-box-containing protein